MRRIYIFGGLGADKRVFKYVDFGKDIEPIFIDWLIPAPKDTIDEYLQKLKQQIQEERPMLIGLSFGGMLAVEYAKKYPYQKIILISSIKSKYEIPLYYRLLGWIRTPMWFPIHWLKKGNFITNRFFGLKSKTEKLLLKSILRDTPESFFRWALQRISVWNNEDIPKNLIHIHGNRDRIIPYRLIKADITIHNGGHFLIVNKAQEISRILKDIFKDS